ncbi:MAG: hypothetical protein HKN43_06320 [Rhodothermales bacterium]|nr:hypothetical protein [Rhodothermales bacterium]
MLNRLSATVLVAILAVVVAACSGDPTGPNNVKTQYEVRYAVNGTCTGSMLNGNQISIAYTIDAGATTGIITTIPFSTTVTINTQGPITAVAIAADCPGGGTTDNTITAEVYVDNNLRDSQSATGSNSLLVTAATVINTTDSQI